MPNTSTTPKDQDNEIVANLIDDVTKWWDVNKVRWVLPPREETEVLKIIIS